MRFQVAVAQKAPLEQRHAVCATISTAVALFSGFFNILPLGLDDFGTIFFLNHFHPEVVRSKTVVTVL